jgi:CRP-like cAMP-binding protein
MRALSTKTLRLSGAIEVRELRDGTRLLKQLARAEYLALTPSQWVILEMFEGRRTVEDILQYLLTQRGHPSIRAFYDLVLSAWNKGFLVEMEDAADASSGPAPVERLTPNAAGSIGVSLLLIALGSYAFLETPIVFGYESVDWLQLVFFVSLGVSLSYALAGATLTGFGRQAANARVRWDRGLPFFFLDTRDAFMGGRLCEIAVSLRALSTPFLLALLAVLAESHNGLLGGGLTMLIVGCPFGATPAHTLLHALFRKEYQLPRCAEKFLNTKLVAQVFNWKEELAEERYLMTFSAYAIAWLGVVFYYSNELFSLLLFQNQTRPLALATQLILSVNIAALALAAAGILGFLLWLLARGAWRLLAPRLFPAEGAVARRVSGQRPPDAELERFLTGNLLFSQLEPGVLQEVIAAMKFVVVEPGATIIRERDLGDAMFVVFTGRVEVSREDEAGHEQRVATLGPGDVFGEIALLNTVPRTSTVRSSDRSGLLMLGKEDFEKLLLRALGAERIRETVQICAFLRRNALFSDWHPQALMSLAHKFAFEDCPAGRVVIEQDQPNNAFYLIYEGEFRVRQDGQAVALLGPGDFAGEISLLHNVPATATVVAEHTGRCLRLGKADFLQFVSHDFLTGMAIESALEARLEQRRAA